MLRQDYGHLACLLAGWEGRFIALLVDAQVADDAATGATRCPASMWLQQKAISGNVGGARYAAAVSVFLFGEKLNDRIRDDGSYCARAAMSLFRHRLEKSESILGQLALPIKKIRSLLVQQIALEAERRHGDLDALTTPFAGAVGLMVAHTAHMAGAVENRSIIYDIGKSVGRLIAIMDACHDFNRDHSKGHYNAIRAALAVGSDLSTLSIFQWEVVKNYLLVTLQSIRRGVQHLKLERYAGAVRNILILGLYDVVNHSVSTLLQNACHELPDSDSTEVCHACNKMMTSNFCSHCGSNRMYNGSNLRWTSAGKSVPFQ